MKKTIRLTESQLLEVIKTVLNEQPWGRLARLARSVFSKTEDDIAKIFGAAEAELAEELDKIVIINGIKKKSITELDTVQKQVMHYFNPQDLANNMEALQSARNFLNGYAKSRKYPSWQAMRNEAKTATQSTGGRTGSSTATASSAASNINNMFKSGSIVSGNSLRNLQPDWSQIKYAKNWDEYNKVIGDAIRTGNFSGISRKGFEKYGLTGEGGFREWIQNLARNMDLGAMSSSGTKDWFFKLR